MGNMVVNPIAFFTDLLGKPLQKGSVYIGTANTNPVTNQLTVYQDAAMTIPMTQPLTTTNGFVSLNGSPQPFFVNAASYALLVNDSNGNLCLSIPNYTNPLANQVGSGGAGQIGFDGTTLDQQFANRVNRVVDSIAVLRTISKATYTRAFVTGYYAAHDGGGGPYQYDPNDTASADNGVTIIVNPTDGGRWKLQHLGRISLMQAGAKGDGSDDTTPIQNAVATGLRIFAPKPSAFYGLTNGISYTTKGQIFEGDGRQISVFKALATFNLSALGVFIGNTGEEGPHFRNLKITFVQPDTGTRANLTNFPPALYMRSTPRFTVENMAITQAMTGIDMAGGTNSGGAFITQLEMSAYNFGVNIDGAQDSVRINKLHFWNFDLTTNQVAIFNDGNTTGVQSARCDDFRLSDSLLINNGKQVNFTSSASGSTFGEVINTDFDTYGGLYMSAGDISMSACFMSVGFAANQAIYQTGGMLKVAGCEIEAAVATTNPLIQLSGPGTISSGYLSIVGGMIRISGDAQAVSVAASSGTNQLIVDGVQFTLPQNTSPANAVIAVAAGGRATITNCRATDKGTGTGNFVQVVVDENHVIEDNALLGWGMSLPATMVNMVVSNNSGPPGNDFTNGYLTGAMKTKRLTGTLDGSGNLTVAHGITSAQQKGLMAQAFYKGASGEMRPLTLGYIDGTNLNATGGTASAAYRATIMWTETQQGW
ncbi:MAG: hypothetical protein EPN70_23090 [Paraburkholderia sp.]|uniref:phage tailspike protein n=1 Tax=Paraburkholderia sp. TaxID=1926495 RepID=UPI0011F8D71E|nr:phage tailspike protein [Paraburkholderia sp.]TAM00138.1 MAG: hypothetical protein EPN70_23090 [Paraburkholderia sp.]TAM32599.1 MAG: hypothetical protein EPN59_01500 [Paraburkholderia sp.]